MARDRGDRKTLDLLVWVPPTIAKSFDSDRVRGHDDRTRMARALAEAIRDSGKSRDAIHDTMVRYLDRDFGRHRLDRWTAPSTGADEPGLTKLIAFLHAVPDIRVVNALLQGTPFAAIPRQYLPAIEAEIVDDQIETLKHRKRAARRKWKGAV